MKRVMLAIQPMYLLMPHDYFLSSIVSFLPIDIEELLKKFRDVFPKYTPFNLLHFLNTSAMMNRDGLSKVNFVKSFHEKVKAQIEKRLNIYAKYANTRRKKMVFKLGDWVWIHLRKNKFTSKRKSTLQERRRGHF